MVTNALKHAFAGRPRGTLVVRLHTSDGRHHLEFEDDGRGIAPGQGDVTSGRTLGLLLMRTLAR